jgi:hypothetical protein
VTSTHATRPAPCMRWRGLAQSRRASGPTSRPPHRRTRHRCQAPAASASLPALAAFPESPPRRYPFPAVGQFYCLLTCGTRPRRHRSEDSFPIHITSTRHPPLSPATPPLSTDPSTTRARFIHKPRGLSGGASEHKIAKSGVATADGTPGDLLRQGLGPGVRARQAGRQNPAEILLPDAQQPRVVR